MEWESTIFSLYKTIVAKIPIQFRSMVKPLLHEAAERKCRRRNSSHINEADLITALIEITPGPFKSQMAEALQDLGVDVGRYVKLKDIQDRYNRSWERFHRAFHPGNYWFGGEAACRRDLRDLIQYCGDRQYFHAISTNSILFDNELAAHCADCHHLELCGGGCRVHAESETGDFFASFSYCWHKNDHQHTSKEE